MFLALRSIPVVRLIPSRLSMHAAAITAESLDSNHDEVVDDQRVVNSHLEFKSGIKIHQKKEQG